MTAQARRTDYAILGCLSLRPMSGYDVKKFVDGSISHVWHESYGQIYPALKRLEAEGLAASRVEESEAGPDRRVYAITDEGLSTLRGWLLEPPIPDVPRYELSLKLFFGAQMPVEVAIEHVERYREGQRERLDAYLRQELELEARLAGAPRLPFWRAVLRGGVRYSRMAIEWCDETLSELRALEDGLYPVDPRETSVEPGGGRGHASVGRDVAADTKRTAPPRSGAGDPPAGPGRGS